MIEGFIKDKMIEGFIKDDSYYFPLDKINEYMNSLKTVNDLKYRPIKLKEKIMIMTHDDYWDKDMIECATWFMLHYENKGFNFAQLHFDKSSELILSEQIDSFYTRPIFNRTHRLLWQSDNFDFPLLAMNGIKIDSSKIGGKPYYPVINSKLLPIAEFPITIADKSIDGKKALYQVNEDEKFFRLGYTPITVLAHPYQVCIDYNFHSCYDKCLELTKKYNYKIVNFNYVMDMLL